MVADPLLNRNESYSLIANELGSRQLAVLEALRGRPMSNKALSKFLRWPINCVTPRVKELRQLGLVRAAYNDIDATTGRKCVIWELVP